MGTKLRRKSEERRKSKKIMEMWQIGTQDSNTDAQEKQFHISRVRLKRGESPGGGGGGWVGVGGVGWVGGGVVVWGGGMEHLRLPRKQFQNQENRKRVLGASWLEFIKKGATVGGREGKKTSLQSLGVKTGAAHRDFSR